MPVKKEREYRTLVAPLAAQSSGEKRLQSECYVEGYATTFNRKDAGGAAYQQHKRKNHGRNKRLHSRLQNGFAGRRRKETGRNRRTDY